MSSVDDSPSAAEPASEQADGFDQIESEERTWAILAHAAALAGFVFPLGNIFGPLLVWAIKKEESPFVAENGRESINFQISWTIWMTISLLSMLIVVGLVLAPIVAIAWFFLVIIGIIRASEEQVYDYPLTYDFVS